MENVPGQPDRHPTAAKVASAAAPPHTDVLEYHGPAPQPVRTAIPWYMWLACTITCVPVGAVMLFSAFLLLFPDDTRYGSWERIDSTIPIVAMIFGVAILIWEYQMIRQRNRACAICVGCAALLVSVPLGLALPEVIRSWSVYSIIPIAMTIGAVFCAVAHFLWAAQLGPPRSRPWRVS